MRMRHGFVVNRFGERFGNEFFGQDIGSKTNHFDTWGEHRFKNVPSYLIFDRNLLEKYSFAGLPPGTTKGLDWVAKGETVAELALKLDLPPEKLEATVTRFNEHARQGRDLTFDRDPVSLGPVEKAPFFGVELVTPDPFRAGTTVVVNTQAQVLNYRTEEPVPGLYACGATTAGSRIWGIGYQAGYSLMACATFGFLAAEHAALTP
jgi:3-oxosteroid 1-dehydrogenase